MPPSAVSRFIAAGLLAAAYFAAGRFGLSLAHIHPSASAIWPPSGLALGALLVLGETVWPGVLVGAFLVNLVTSGSPAACAMIAVGNTLEAVLGARLVRRHAGGASAFSSARDFLTFVALASVLSPTVSASVGTTTLAVSGLAQWSAYGPVWFTWWLGDAAGIVIVTPALVLWSKERRLGWSGARSVEALLVLVATMVVGVVVFSAASPIAVDHRPDAFFCIPVVVWAALRFGPREAATVTLLLGALAVWGTMRGYGPFAGGPEDLPFLPAFMAMIAVIGVILGATVAEAGQAIRTRDEAARAEAVALEMLQEADRRKDEFLATLSHEIRSPLNAVLIWTHMLRSGSLDPAKAAEALEIIERNTRLQVRLIEDLLDISRISAGKLTVDVIDHDLASVVQAALETARPAAENKSITLNSHIATPPLYVHGDPARLQQVVGNLLSNAVKFTNAGGRIDVEAYPLGPEAVVVVRDTGQGIRADLIDKIFDRFEQADSSITRQHQGLGLGLAIARHLVEVHGGRIRAESEGEGKGATFTVALPIVDVPVLARLPAAASPPAPDGHQALRGLRVLLVDDDADGREAVDRILSGAGAEVVSAASVPRALELFRERPPDVVLTDLAMPDQDGFALLRAVREHEAANGRKVPAIALTTLASLDDRLRTRAAGFDRHVAKPVSPLDLIAAVSSASSR